MKTDWYVGHSLYRKCQHRQVHHTFAFFLLKFALRSMDRKREIVLNENILFCKLFWKLYFFLLNFLFDVSVNLVRKKIRYIGGWEVQAVGRKRSHLDLPHIYWWICPIYRVSFLTGPTQKVLSVKLHSKLDQKSSKCQNLLTGWHFWAGPVKKFAL